MLLDADGVEAKGARLHDAAADTLAPDEADLVLLGELLVAVDALDSEADPVYDDVAAEVAEGDGRGRGGDGGPELGAHDGPAEEFMAKAALSRY